MKKLKWFLFIILLAILCYLIQYIFISQKTYFDITVYESISKIMSEPLTIIMKIFTIIGSAITIASVTIAIFCIAGKKYGKYAVINLVTIYFINQILKIIFSRPRPEEYRLIQETGYSFPSGHSMVSMAFYGLIIYWIFQKVKNPYIKWCIGIMLAILIICVGISRIYLGVHYASDVIAGFCFSVAYLICFTHLMKGGKEGETN